jgi:hypothetical protein
VPVFIGPFRKHTISYFWIDIFFYFRVTICWVPQTVMTLMTYRAWLTTDRLKQHRPQTATSRPKIPPERIFKL